jgi:hypothetical protein
LKGRNLFILVALILTACSTQETEVFEMDVVGIWQFPEREVWVQVREDGRVYQCRIDTNGVVISANGTLTKDTINWEEVWEQDHVRREGNVIYLKGIYGDFGFMKTTDKMSSKCEYVNS